jgi:hypothetical protein
MPSHGPTYDAKVTPHAASAASTRRFVPSYWPSRHLAYTLSSTFRLRPAHSASRLAPERQIETAASKGPFGRRTSREDD